jgi:hypothetical protein
VKRRAPLGPGAPYLRPAVNAKRLRCLECGSVEELTCRLLGRSSVCTSCMKITVERYARTRFWAVYERGELLCVTVYKKGALAVQKRLRKAPRVVHRAVGRTTSIDVTAPT